MRRSIKNKNKVDPSTCTTAHKRLMKDYAEVMAEPLPLICARPDPSDLFQWYANILAPEDSAYHGIVLHLSITFTEDYPHVPPEVYLYSSLVHSHVYNGQICLDLLGTHSSWERHHGWSSAYSVQSILSQLQCFLLEEDDGILNKSQRLINRDIYNSLCVRNIIDERESIKHSIASGEAWPWRDDWPAVATMAQFYHTYRHGSDERLKVNLYSDCSLGKMPEEVILSSSEMPCPQEGAARMNQLASDMLLHIFQYLPEKDIRTARNVSIAWKEISKSPVLTTARDILCFFSRNTWEDDTIGIGFNIEFNLQNKLNKVEPFMDMLGHSSYSFDEVRSTSWNQEFVHWIPLYVNQRHSLRAIPLFEESVMKVFYNMPNPSLSLNPSVEQKQTNERRFNPAYAVELCCVAMNNMIVDIMKGTIHASIQALQGYCFFHRWLLYLVQTYPSVLKDINSTVEQFLLSENNRTKKNCPDIGVLIAMLTVSDYNWNHVKKAVVEETLNRQAMWVQKAVPTLGTVSDNRFDENERNRLRRSFEHSQVGLKMLMFNVYFLTMVVNDPNLEVPDAPSPKELQHMSEVYNKYFGMATERQKTNLQEVIFDIRQISSYSEFFTFVQLQEFNSTEKVHELLCKAMRYSERVGYHTKQQRRNKRSDYHSNDRGTEQNNRRNRQRR